MKYVEFVAVPKRVLRSYPRQGGPGRERPLIVIPDADARPVPAADQVTASSEPGSLRLQPTSILQLFSVEAVRSVQGRS